MPIARLSIDIEAKLANLQAGLDKAGFMAEKSVKKIEAAFDSLSSSAKMLGGALGVAFSVEAIRSYFMSISHGLDALNDLKVATGASIGNLSALEDIAARNGIAFDQVGDALIKMNKALEAARDPASDQAEAFKSFGLNVNELLKMDPAVALQKMSIAVMSFADNGDKARNMQIIFNKSLRESAVLMREIAEAGDLKATVTEAEVMQAKKFNDELSAWNKNMTDFARTVQGPVISALNALFDKFKEGAAKGRPWWAQILGETEIARLTGLRESLPGFGKAGETGGATGGWDGGASGGWGAPKFVTPIPIKGKPSKAEKAGISAIFDPQESFRMSELALQSKVNETLATEALTAAEKARAEAMKPVEDRVKRLNDLLAATPSAKLEKDRADMLLLLDAFNDASISAEQFSEAATTSLGLIGPAVKEATDEMQVFAEQAARNIQDALGNTLQQTMEGNFKNIGQMWISLINKMVAEAAAANIAKELFGDFGKTGNMGGWIGSLIAAVSTSAVGNAFGPAGLIAFAAGGVVTRPTAFAHGGGLGIMGEAGPEAILPLKRGRGGRLGVESSGRAVQVTNHFTLNVPADRRTQQQIAAAVGRSVTVAAARY